MARSDYAHHNEDADRIWWEEEGRHDAQPDLDDHYADEEWLDVDPDDPDTEAWLTPGNPIAGRFY